MAVLPFSSSRGMAGRHGLPRFLKLLRWRCASSREPLVRRRFKSGRFHKNKKSPFHGDFLFGGGHARLLEHQGPVGFREYKVLWKRQELDLAELAKLRWVKKLTLEEIAQQLNVGRTTVVRSLSVIRNDRYKPEKSNS